MSAQSIIESYNIPTDSFNSAIRFLSNRDPLDPCEYRARTQELSGMGDSVSDKLARFVYLYLIQETVRQLNSGSPVDIKATYEYAYERTLAFEKKHSYVFVSTAPRIDAGTGKPKAKKGAKRDLAMKLYAENQDKNLSRKEWIKLLMDEAGMTKGGASTYYNGLKNGSLK